MEVLFYSREKKCFVLFSVGISLILFGTKYYNGYLHFLLIVKPSLTSLFKDYIFDVAGLSFAYQLLYLLDATGFYSLGLQVIGVHVCRATGQELVIFFSFTDIEILRW